MNDPLALALPLIAAYLVGSIPFGLLVARLVKGVDIRQVGSGNIGATNVARSIGKPWGMAVLILDALKGLLPTLLFPAITLGSSDPNLKHVQVFCGLAAILGHMFPCWLRFRGGKGVATALGVVVVLVPIGSLTAAGVFVLSFAIWRIVSLSSIFAALSFAAFGMWNLWPTPFSTKTWSLAAFSLAIPLLIIARHRTNISRLLRGEEQPFRRSAEIVENPSETQQETRRSGDD